MKTLLLIRTLSHQDGTFGHLLHDADRTGFHVHTLEPEAARQGNKGRIPSGVYDVLWEPVGKFRGYALKNVPGFENIEIHIGNTEDDTRGCILLGLRRGQLLNKEAVLDSGQAVTRLGQYLNYQPFKLAVIEHFTEGESA